MAQRESIIIAIDFDGTCVEHDYPNIGLEVEGAVETLLRLNNRGHKLILNTMRSGERLDAAVKWFKERHIELWGVNKNPEQSEWTSSPKVFAHLYIDDSALGCPVRFIDGVRHHVVDWSRVSSELEYHNIL